MEGLTQTDDPRVLSGISHNEDAAILSFPPGKALVQTLDFFTPIVNNPYYFGQIAAANALSDVYAMGGQPYSAMNIVLFPIKTMDRTILREILKGGLDKIREAGAVLAGGHSIEDSEVKYGLSVSGIVDEDGFATNGGAKPGDALIVTKPLGTGVMATAIKANWTGAEALEQMLYQWAGRLNKAGGEIIQRYQLKGATDVTGFGLGGHLLEMARASKVHMEIDTKTVPIIMGARELAEVGMIPAGSFANKHYCAEVVSVASSVDAILADLIFDAQTSGGLILAVPEDRVEPVQNDLLAQGDMAAVIGRVGGPSLGSLSLF